MKRESVTAYIGLGANLGDPAAALRQAREDLAALPHSRVLAASSLFRTAPVDAQGPDYSNAVIALETGLTAPDLLAHLHRIELAAGRERPWRNAPRTLDLDLLLYGDARIDSAALVLPHPRWRERAFVLVPLAEIAPQRVAPADLQAVAGQAIERVGPF